MKDLPDNAKKVFEGVLFDVYQWEQKMYDGTKAIFEKIVRHGSTQLIIVTKDKKLILLNEEQPSRGKFLGLPGGMIDNEEEPLVAAKRELLEELGYETNNIELFYEGGLGSKVIWPTYYYIVKDCKKIQEPQLESGEKIEPMEIEFDEFLEKIEISEFKNRQFSDMLFRIKNDSKKLKKFKEKLFG